jgi:hypothetical protein
LNSISPTNKPEKTIIYTGSKHYERQFTVATKPICWSKTEGEGVGFSQKLPHTSHTFPLNPNIHLA